MVRTKLSEIQKKADVDLYIIIIVTLLVLGTYMGFQSKIQSFAQNENIHIILRTIVISLFQFGVAGLGITIVSIFRRESFQNYGLIKKDVVKTILLSCLVFIPYTIFIIATGKFNGYLPFKSVLMTKEILGNSFPINMIGMAFVVTAWGFFEGFNYVVICEKLNIRYPSSKKWLNFGAIFSAIMCLLIHGLIGVTPEGIIEMVSVFIIIYGMLVIKEKTGNAWGCVFIFVFLWNAF